VPTLGCYTADVFSCCFTVQSSVFYAGSYSSGFFDFFTGLFTGFAAGGTSSVFYLAADGLGAPAAAVALDFGDAR
jgi:uncharacterized membrane protein AbrB (regulator of aidB expression)